MYKKLTNEIYWGDYHSINELKDVVKGVVCVSSNHEMLKNGYSPLNLPYTVPYFKLAERDRSSPSNKYFDSLYSIFQLYQNRYSPILIHCYMGHHRSPIIAIMAALSITNKKDHELEDYYNKLINIVESSLPEFSRTRNFNYSIAAQLWIKAYLLCRKTI